MVGHAMREEGVQDDQKLKFMCGYFLQSKSDCEKLL